MAINFEEISFQIITFAGEAKSKAFAAINSAESNQFAAAWQEIDLAYKAIIAAEKVHLEVIQQEAQGVKHEFSVLFMHAEDQMLTSQSTIDFAERFINIYKLINDKCNNKTNNK
ncbi:lichenan-specific PTS system IIA component [Spiroplasma clarkii]|uniref:PTS system, cellobiose-specific IIA component n=1 Tax=Spiroplasma clarkii TaxID=2139 RepID=A0A1Y0L205_9MOLU|nr:PTS lactose/cellobiose transporter subunit IIA [Spiroplasma clarkii]ARU91765.1 lichenan-specific PTS system IIA component [Spiroplasma clarkii]ATX71138.1 PTS system, cellobiose-specific IIA component [Spiroplasma clarkii]